MIYLFKNLAQKAVVLPKQVLASTVIHSSVTKQSKLRIRTVNFSELEYVRNTWLVNEGWPSVRHGLPATYSLDPQGFYWLELNDTPVASISFVTYPAIELAYVGMYVVSQELRGQGYGDIIFNQVREYSEKERAVKTIGLNCFASMSPLYQKWGFRTTTIDDIWKYTFKHELDSNLVPEYIAEDQFAEIVSYDAEVFGCERVEFLANFINKPQTITAISKDKDEITGYGIISSRLPAKEEPNASYRIGPLYADNQMIAADLIARLIAAINAQPADCVFLETPGNNIEAAKVVSMLGFEKIASMDKMYKGPEPKFNTKKMFCYCSLATGG